MQANEYLVLERAIDEGVEYGFMRAYKHNTAPNEDDMREAVKMAVLNSVCEWFTFQGSPNGSV